MPAHLPAAPPTSTSSTMHDKNHSPTAGKTVRPTERLDASVGSRRRGLAKGGQELNLPFLAKPWDAILTKNTLCCHNVVEKILLTTE
ncbi:hypothetical protein D9611_013028 [Ephemerocybe angulata]|uniref:Uncharacterized protein n=1 Tax=Ephemerocybe angulata TaxID=980116 RepID=A0A8H5ESY3_9AGAR|nr:hypothetical protein D9611_013028 [Tulosesus angulatus]